MTLPQFEQRGRLDRAFEMQMELGLREREDEAGRLQRHGSDSKGSGHLTIGSSGDLSSKSETDGPIIR
jgi:hypothetical protein